MDLKEKLLGALGTLGYIIWLLISFIGFIFPIIMITLSFDLPFWATFILLPIRIFVPFAGHILLIIGLIGAIMGVQDVIAIVYYVYAAIVLIPDILKLLSIFKD